MREILFRGKRVYNGEWAYGSLILWKDGDAEICVSSTEEREEQSKFIVHPETVGQYTGLTDKNGEKVFDGDILEAITGNPVGEPIVVNVVVNLDDYELMWDIEHSYEIEVIGNIHDNPELLGGAEMKDGNNTNF